MSHPHKTIVCPNCGFHASNNYCSQCGQENHLHKDSFWGLVTHFIGHYFHYDSKFWQTIKALWFSPGKLTLAYLNKQRMRYIPPVSLYIFISAVYFLLSLLLHTKTDLVKISDGKQANDTKNVSLLPKGGIPATDSSNAKFNIYVENKLNEIRSKHGDVGEFVRENVSHNLPKIFFCMIPVMAMLLKLLFIRRKEFYFVDHSIFALHYHSFWFSIFAVQHFHFPEIIKQWLYLILFFIAIAYMVMAMRNVYKTGWGKSVLKSVLLSLSYSLLLGIILFSYLLLVVLLA